MSGFLFHETVFGPVRSRRLGNSLGINLLPRNRKVCTFDCIYCECGWSPKEDSEGGEFPTRAEVAEALELALIRLKAENNPPDSITFSGNGEPTIHPDFLEIVEDTIALRDKYFPEAEVTVLSNASLVHRKRIFDALNKVDNNILKLDAGREETFRLINRPRSNDITLEKIVQQLKRFNRKVIIQSLFVRGEMDGIPIDNTTPEEVEAWVKHIRYIRPRYVMLYPIARQTPLPGLQVISKEELLKIAEKLRPYRISCSVY